MRLEDEEEKNYWYFLEDWLYLFSCTDSLKNFSSVIPNLNCGIVSLHTIFINQIRNLDLLWRKRRYIANGRSIKER